MPSGFKFGEEMGGVWPASTGIEIWGLKIVWYVVLAKRVGEDR